MIPAGAGMKNKSGEGTTKYLPRWTTTPLTSGSVHLKRLRVHKAAHPRGAKR